MMTEQEHPPLTADDLPWIKDYDDADADADATAQDLPHADQDEMAMGDDAPQSEEETMTADVVNLDVARDDARRAQEEETEAEEIHSASDRRRCSSRYSMN